MKTLLIDAGNSHLKWAWLTRQGMIQDAATAAYDASTTQVLDAAWLDMLPPQRVLVASVVPRFTTELTRWLAERWGCPVECVQSQAQGFGVTSGYQQPATLGVDRWLAMIAARDYGEEVCIYDCGTALTIDVLIQGRHQGGLIFPGSRLLQRSLWQGTQAIPTDLAPTMSIEPALANNTAQCVANGSVFALLAIIRQFADQAGQRPAGQQAVHLLCGGEAERLLPWLDQRFLHRPHLVLQGLATIAMAQ